MSDIVFNKWLQSRLTSHGYAVGMIDGDIGPVTIKALKAFQAALGLEPNGRADQATTVALRATSTGPVSRSPVVPAAAAAPLKSAWPVQAQVPKFFGEVGTNQVQIDIPFDMWLSWDRGQRVRKMTLHRKVAPSATLVFEQIGGVYSISDRKALGLDIFGGSLNVRKMRGGTSWSMHSWGIAIDFDPERNALNTHSPAARLSHSDALPFWQAWEGAGWLSLGRARNYDWMHVQAALL